MNLNNQYGYNLIENIIYKINNKSLVIKYNSKEYIISLKTSENYNKSFYIDNYELRYFRKNSKPNYDLPAIYSSDLLKNIINEKLCLISKSNLFIMLLEKIEDNNKDVRNQNDNLVVENNININKNVKIKIKKINYKDKNSEHTCKNKCIII